nr:hypothetical protein [Tanacetum cinerariifolium]
MVDFIAAPPLRHNLKLRDEDGIVSIPDTKLFENLTLMGYALTFSPTVYVSHIRQFWSTTRIETTEEGTKILTTVDGAVFPSVEVSNPYHYSVFESKEANIAKTSTLPGDSTPRVPSIATDDASMQQKLDELTALCTSLQRQQSEMAFKFAARDLEISQLKARVKLLEDREGGGIAQSGEDAPIKGRSLDEWEAATTERSAKKGSDDTKEMVTVLTSLDAATILSSGVAKVPTSSGSIPLMVPLLLEFPLAVIWFPLLVARELEKEMARDAQRMNEQITRDAEIARIHAEKELQMMIDGLDRNNETVAKYL